MTKKQKEKRNRAELTKLARSGNRFAKHQLKCDETGLPTNLEALFEFPCPHGFETPYGEFISLRFSIVRGIQNGFQIADQICPICGKVVEKTVFSVKEPRRGC